MSLWFLIRSATEGLATRLGEIILNPHRHDIEKLYAHLHSSAQGLTQAEATRQQAKYGINQIEKISGQSFAGKLLKEFTHFFALILWLAAGLAFFAEWREPGQGMATLGYAVLGVIIVNGLFSFWQEYRAEKALSALRNLLPRYTTALREGKAIKLLVSELVPGDVVLLVAGDDVPADCRLIEASGVRVNTANLTGESRPMARNTSAKNEEQPALRQDILHAGTSLISGEAKAMVYSTGMHTEFGNIARLTQVASEPPSPLQKEIARLSRLIALFAILLGAVFFVIVQWIGMSFWANLLFAIGIIVANVPEGLLPTVTLSLALATQRMAKKNALVRHLPAVETLGAATVICSDKTGTLTQNRMGVREVFTPELLATHRPSSPALLPLAGEGIDTSLLAILRHCHNLHRVEHNGQIAWQGDPMEVALLEAVPPGGAMFPRIDEIPFDTERKRMSVICDTPQGLVLYCKGAPETVLPLCSATLELNQFLPPCRGKARMGVESVSLNISTPTRACVVGAQAPYNHGLPFTGVTLPLQGGGDVVAPTGLSGIIPLDAAGRAHLLAEQERMAEQGLRVLALAYRNLPSAADEREAELVFAGLIGLVDPPRPGVAEAIATCRAAGIRVIMVTGDHPHTASALAREIGLAQKPVAVTGDTLRTMSDIDLQLLLDEPELIFARTGADQKMRIVQALQRKGEIVAVTGDGVNDAPALKCADVGIAMGISGTDVAKEAADIILLDDNFASIVAAIEEGRAVYNNLRKFLTYILTSNIPEMVPYLAFVLFTIPLPLTIIQILAVDLGTDMLPALALGTEKPDPDTMRRPPRPRDERLLSWPLLARAYLFLGPLEAVAGMAAFFFVLHGAGWQFGSELGLRDHLYLQATTACLSAIIAMQMVNVLLCRHPTTSAFSRGHRLNHMIVYGIAFELVLLLLIVYTPWGNALFGTAPLGWAVWLFILPFALGFLLLEEGRKAVVRRRIVSGR
jgi:magnesium-transporting ATPase (P-type)